MVRADGDWPTARQAVLATSIIRYFGQAPAHAGTLEAIGAGLGWPPGYLLRILTGNHPGQPARPQLWKPR